MSMIDHRARYSRFSIDRSGSLWFQRFYSGCQNRMGAVWKPNLALSTNLLLSLFREVEANIQDSTEKNDENM